MNIVDPTRNTIAIICMLFLFCMPTSALAYLDDSANCRIWDKKITQLLEEKLGAKYRKVCFRGEIDKAAADKIVKLKGIISVINFSSKGGDVEAAIRIAERLRRDQSKVIIERQCLSSCANYILPAAERLFVGKGAIIAMHGAPPSNYRDYFALGRRGGAITANTKDKKIEEWERYKSGPMRQHIDFFRSIGVSSWFAECYASVSISLQAMNNKKIKWLVVDKPYAENFLENVEYWDRKKYEQRNHSYFSKYVGDAHYVWGREALEFC